MPITLDGDGWSDITPASGDRYIYVSNAGSDSNGGLSVGAPKATVAAGFALVRNNTSDQVLLRRGDTFTATITINKSGRDASNPAVIGAYGTTSNARPIVTGGVNLQSGSFWAIQSIDFRGDGVAVGAIYAQGSLGLQGSSILIEDCIARNYDQAFGQAYCFTSATGVPGGTYWNDITIRRCTAVDSDGFHGQGLFADAFGGQLTVQDFTLINCGINDTQSHCIYVDKAVATTTTPIFTRVICWPDYPTGGNVSTTSEGIKCRQGGIVDDCHVAYCAIGIVLGETNGDGSNDFEPLSTVQAKVQDCIITYPCGMTTANGYGYGTWLLGIEGTGNYYRRNGHVHNNSTASDRAWLHLIRWGTQTLGQIDNLTISENVAYNAGKFVVGDLPANYTNMVFSGNKVRMSASFTPLIECIDNTSQPSIWTERANNSLWSGNGSTSGWVSAPANGNLTAWGATSAGSAGAGLPEPARTYTGYLDDIGVTVADEAAAHAHIRTQLIAQRRYAWNTAYTATALNDWFRFGLGIPTLGDAPVTPSATAPSYYLETIGAR